MSYLDVTFYKTIIANELNMKSPSPLAGPYFNFDTFDIDLSIKKDAEPSDH